jgi:hypothetical protein
MWTANSMFFGGILWKYVTKSCTHAAGFKCDIRLGDSFVTLLLSTLKGAKGV